MARIIVVDDEVQVREMLRATLERAGHEVIEADHGEDAIEILDADTADLMITDILMPKKEGIETIRELRQKQPLVKIIAYTGGGQNDPEHYLQYARYFGADKTFPKPMDIDELLASVEELTSRANTP